MAKIFIDFANYPEAKKLTKGQRINLTLSGSAIDVSGTGVTMAIESFKLGKKGKMNTQEVLLNNMDQRLKSIEAGQANQATRI